MRLNELPPGFVPGPARNRMVRSSEPWDKGINVGGDGSLRLCACRSFGVYLSPRGWRRLYREGEELVLRPMRPDCDLVTRETFGVRHGGAMMDRLTKAKGFGYKACLFPDETPRDPFEVAEMFGFFITEKWETKLARTQAAVARRGKWDSNGNKALEHGRADNIAELI